MVTPVVVPLVAVVEPAVTPPVVPAVLDPVVPPVDPPVELPVVVALAPVDEAFPLLINVPPEPPQADETSEIRTMTLSE
jgi:hypothetical protein